MGQQQREAFEAAARRRRRRDQSMVWAMAVGCGVAMAVGTGLALGGLSMTTFLILYFLAGLICADWQDGDRELSAVEWLTLTLVGPVAVLVGVVQELAAIARRALR